MLRLCMYFCAIPATETCACGAATLQKRWRNSSGIPNSKRLQQQVEKFLVRKKFEKKFYDKEGMKFLKPLTPHISSNPKILHPGVIQREKTICNLLRTEIQNLVDSGELGEEVQLLELTFTKASMSSANVCRVFWEPCMSVKDLEISEILNRLSGRLRHVLMTSRIMNNVPTIHFYVDDGAYRAAIVDKILESEDLDVGEEDGVLKDLALNPEANEEEPNSLFGLDRENLIAKLTILKETNKVDKS